MCDCKMKLNALLLLHKTCREFKICSVDKIDTPIILPEIIAPHVLPVVDIIMTDFVNEVNNFFNDTGGSLDEVRYTVCSEPMIIIETPEVLLPACGDETSSEEEDNIVELTDISPEELIAQEEEEKRIKDELALIQLTKLTKKKVRTKK